MNLIDVLLIAGIALYALGNARRGVLRLTLDLTALVIAFLFALRFYPVSADLLTSLFSMSRAFANAGGFLLLFILMQLSLSVLAARALDLLPSEWHRSPASQALALLPGALHGMLLAAALLLLLVGAPISVEVRGAIGESRLGSALVERASTVEEALQPAIGEAIQETLTFLTVQPESDASIAIPTPSGPLEVDEAAEERMLALVNAERSAVGAPPLTIDPTIVEVAREHSRDMWERGYFAHVNPDGDDPFDRMSAGGVSYRSAGENLALAPSTERAHRGLMNSPGHRRNILDPDFRRVGIGVIDGGIHGKMYTQNFAN